MTIRTRTRTATSALLPTAPAVNATPWRDVRLMPATRGPFAPSGPTSPQPPLVGLLTALSTASAAPRVPLDWRGNLAPKPIAIETLLPRFALPAPVSTQLGTTTAAPMQRPAPSPPAARPAATLLGY